MLDERKIRKVKNKLTKAMSRSDWDDALEYVLVLREIDPDDNRHLLKLGEIHQRLEHNEEAKKAYAALVELYAEDGRLAKAISVSKMLLQIDPDDQGVQKKLALLYSARGLPSGMGLRELQLQAPPAPPVASTRDPTPAPPAPGPVFTELDGPSGADILAELEAAEDPFRPTAEETARKQIALKDLQNIDLDELDLAFVEIAPGTSAPEIPLTPLFSDLAPEELHAVMGEVRLRRFEAGDVVVKEGDDGRSLFVVAEGVVSVRTSRSDGEEIEVAQLEEGAFFGEFGLFSDGKRHATVIAKDEVQLLEIHHDDLMEVAKKHPRVKQVLRDFYRKRALDKALAASQLFGHLGPEPRSALGRMAAIEAHKSGSMILQEGDDAVGLYLVKQGLLQVQSRDVQDRTVVHAELRSGDFFGEISTLTGAPITADVVAVEDSEVLKFSRTEVLQICNFYPEVKEALEKTSQRRLHESIDRLSESGIV